MGQPTSTFIIGAPASSISSSLQFDTLSSPFTGSFTGSFDGDGKMSDSTFSVVDNADNTKEIAFQASGIATSTTRTITMPDEDVDLGVLATTAESIIFSIVF